MGSALKWKGMIGLLANLDAKYRFLIHKIYNLLNKISIRSRMFWVTVIEVIGAMLMVGSSIARDDVMGIVFNSMHVAIIEFYIFPFRKTDIEHMLESSIIPFEFLRLLLFRSFEMSFAVCIVILSIFSLDIEVFLSAIGFFFTIVALYGIDVPWKKRTSILVNLAKKALDKLKQVELPQIFPAPQPVPVRAMSYGTETISVY